MDQIFVAFSEYPIFINFGAVLHFREIAFAVDMKHVASVCLTNWNTKLDYIKHKKKTTYIQHPQKIKYLVTTSDALEIVPRSVMFYYCVWYDF